MGMMQQMQSGRSSAPPRILVYGTEGIGKSTLAAGTPHPIFVQTEDGLGEISCHKFPLARSFADVQTALTELHTEQHDYPTLAGRMSCGGRGRRGGAASFATHGRVRTSAGNLDRNQRLPAKRFGIHAS